MVTVMQGVKMQKPNRVIFSVTQGVEIQKEIQSGNGYCYARSIQKPNRAIFTIMQGVEIQRVYV